MRKLTAFLVIILGILFLLSAVMSASYLVRSRTLLGAGETDPSHGAMTWHAVLFLPETRDVFFSQLETALIEAAASSSVALEIHRMPLQTNQTQTLRELESAVLSRPDGLLVFGSGIPGYREMLDRAVKAGIKVITLVSDVPGSRRQAFVGSNTFSQGTMAGKLSLQFRPRGGRIGLIMNEIDPEAGQTRSNLMLSGLAKAIQGGRDQRIISVQISRAGLLSGEEAAWDLLSRYSDMNVLICTTAKDSLGAAQSVVDKNRVGKVTIIACDDQPEIVSYLQKGVIQASIIRNPSGLGTLAMETFTSLMQGKGSSSVLDPGLSTIMLEKAGRNQASRVQTQGPGQ